MSEFSDRPFMAGSLIGLRAFAVDSFGRLMGPSYNQVFRPGENVAECRRRDDSRALAFGGFVYNAETFVPRLLVGMDPTGAPTISMQPETAEEAQERREKAAEERARKEAERKANHSLASILCTCGFYAYFNGRNDYKDGDRITALIEGYGVCTVGSDGFRAEKARLVALVRPGKRVPVDLIARNYPDVPMYDRKREAIAAHPLSTDPIPSPDDEDFWTRSAS